MTTAITETEVRQNQARLRRRIVDVDQQQRSLAPRAARGDASAQEKLDELRVQRADLTRELADQDLLAAGLADEAAAAKQAELEHQRQVEADRRAAAEAQYQAQLVERDKIAIDGLQVDLAQLVERFRAGMKAGQSVDEKTSATGRAGGPAHAVETPKAMAQYACGYLIRELDRLLPGLGMVFASGTAMSMPVPPLSRTVAATTTVMPPDHWVRRSFEPSGPQVRDIGGGTVLIDAGVVS